MLTNCMRVTREGRFRRDRFRVLRDSAASIRRRSVRIPVRFLGTVMAGVLAVISNGETGWTGRCSCSCSFSCSFCFSCCCCCEGVLDSDFVTRGRRVGRCGSCAVLSVGGGRFLPVARRLWVRAGVPVLVRRYRLRSPISRSTMGYGRLRGL